jgi:hypothetical protein
MCVDQVYRQSLQMAHLVVAISRTLSRALLMDWKAGMEPLSPSIINVVRLSAVRKMLTEAKRNGMIGPEED